MKFARHKLRVVVSGLVFVRDDYNVRAAQGFRVTVLPLARAAGIGGCRESALTISKTSFSPSQTKMNSPFEIAGEFPATGTKLFRCLLCSMSSRPVRLHPVCAGENLSDHTAQLQTALCPPYRDKDTSPRFDRAIRCACSRRVHCHRTNQKVSRRARRKPRPVCIRRGSESKSSRQPIRKWTGTDFCHRVPGNVLSSRRHCASRLAIGIKPK